MRAMRRATGSLFTTIALDPLTAVPPYRQLCDALRAMILSGQLPAGSRLPSTRTVAGELGSPSTVSCRPWTLFPMRYGNG